VCTTISIELFERSEGELYPNELRWFAARAFGSRSATGPSWAPCLRRRKRLSSGALQHGSTIYHRLGRHATPAKLISQNNPTQQADRLKLLSIALEQIAGINPHLNRCSATIWIGKRVLTLIVAPQTVAPGRRFHPTAGIWGCSTPSTNHGLEPASARLTYLQPISPMPGLRGWLTAMSNA
jgi:hypothetical protein